MHEQCLPADHPTLLRELETIVGTYTDKGDLDQALEFFQKKLDFNKSILGEKHPRIAQLLMIRAKILKFKDLNRSLNDYEQALVMLEQSVSIDHLEIANCLNDMAALYLIIDMEDKALQCHIKALNFYRQILSSDHVNIAHSCRNIGLNYWCLNNFAEALRYLNESVSIYRISCGQDSEEVKVVEADIDKLKAKQKTIENNSHHTITAIPDSNCSSSPSGVISQTEIISKNTAKKSTIPPKSKTCIIE